MTDTPAFPSFLKGWKKGALDFQLRSERPEQPDDGNKQLEEKVEQLLKENEQLKKELRSRTPKVEEPKEKTTNKPEEVRTPGQPLRKEREKRWEPSPHLKEAALKGVKRFLEDTNEMRKEYYRRGGRVEV